MDIVFGYLVIGLAIAILSEVFFGKVKNDEFMSRFLLWPLHIFIATIDILQKLLGSLIVWCNKKITEHETEHEITETLEELNRFSRVDLDATTLDEWYWVEQEARCGIDRESAKTKLKNFIEKIRRLH